MSYETKSATCGASLVGWWVWFHMRLRTATCGVNLVGVVSYETKTATCGVSLVGWWVWCHIGLRQINECGFIIRLSLNWWEWFSIRINWVLNDYI